MDKPQLALGIIVKDEAKTLPTLLKSIVPYVDQVIVTDTGSTDNTKMICERYCGKKLKWTEFEWCDDFSAARQYNLEQCDADWYVWADADDEIINAQLLKKTIKYCDEYNVNAVMFPYHYVIDEQGKTHCLQTRERLIRNNDNYEWVGKLHEGLIPKKRTAKAVKLETVQWLHRADTDRVEASKHRNVDILEKALEKEILDDNVDPRTVYNLGNAYFTVNKYEMAVAMYQKYVPMSGWDEEKYLAHHRSSLGLLRLGDFDNAINAAFAAMKVNPKYPDAYIDLGKIRFDQGDYDQALHWFDKAQDCEFPENLPVVNPMDYRENLWWLLGHTYIKLGKFREAQPFFQAFKKELPDHESIDMILDGINEAMKEYADVKALTYVGKLLGPDFWSMVPEKYLEFPEILVEKNKIVNKPDSTGKDIAIYCGKCIVEWDDSSVDNGGIGGSEEAVVNLSRRLAKMGWNVTVFGRPFTDGVQNGVEYKSYTKYNPRDKWDIFISWRMPSVFNADLNATKKYLWLHDTTPEGSIGPDALANLDKIIVLSDYHRSLYPHIDDEKFMLSGNGIDPAHFETEVEKNLNKCIYTSAPDRGLEALLQMWPEIRKGAPDAELHWFYGWETYDKLHEGNPQKAAYKAHVKALLDQDGVFEHPRVNHVEIAKQMQESQLWVYPTEFTEIYCISAIKAQAANALPVTTTVAALDQRVQYGTKIDVNDIYSNKDAQQKFVDTVVEYLNDPNKVDLEREGMKKWATEEHSWDKTAQQWDEEFKK